VIKPGGRAAVVVWGARRNCGWADIFPIVDARVKSEVCPLFFRLGTGDALTRALETAGFMNVRSERLAVPLRYGTPDEACAAAFLGGPVALAYSRFAADVREQVHAEYLHSIAPYQDGGGYSVPGEFVVAVGSVD
jgi:hypothetical protein